VVIWIISVGCSNNGKALAIPNERIVNRTLTEEEMAIPAVRYQTGVNIERNRQVDYPSLKEKPEIQWSVKNVPNWNSFHVMVDRESCTWYPTGRNLAFQDTLIRLNPDGSEILKKMVSTYEGHDVFDFIRVGICPVIMCENALVCVYVNQSKEQLQSDDEGLPMSLLCFDLKGEIVWKTEVFNSTADAFAWRIPDDRIIVPAGAIWDKHELQVIRLADGEISDRFELADWDGGLYSLGPVYMDDGGFISYRDIESDRVTLARFNSDHSIKWETGEVDNKIAEPPVLMPDGSVAFASMRYLASVDAETGQLLWDNDDYKRYQIRGVDQKGNLLVFYDVGQGYRLSKFDARGLIRNSILVNRSDFESKGSLIIFNDSNYLFGHSCPK
jgi:outer membrane protein assembly factor BamB